MGLAEELQKITSAISGSGAKVDKISGINNAVQRVSGDPDPSGINDDPQRVLGDSYSKKSTLVQGAKEAASMLFLGINSLSKIAVNAELPLYEGTQAAKIQAEATARFEKLKNEDSQKGAAARALASAASANTIKNTFLASPAFNAATGIIIAGVATGGIGAAVAVGGIAVEAGVEAKKINDIHVLRDEYYHLHDFANSKTIKKSALELLNLELKESHNQDRTELDIQRIIGVSPTPENDKNPKLEKIEEIESFKKKALKDSAKNIFKKVANNVISTGSTAIHSPVVAAKKVGELVASSVIETSSKMSEEEIKNGLLTEINALRKESPKYKTHEAEPSKMQLYLHKIKVKISESIGKEPPPEPTARKVSRKYDLANIALTEKVQALALTELALDEEFKSNLVKLSKESKGSKTYEAIEMKLIAKHLEVRGTILDSVKKENFYQNEQIKQPTNNITNVLKSLSTVKSTVSRYFHPFKKSENLESAKQDAKNAIDSSSAQVQKKTAEMLRRKAAIIEEKAKKEEEKRLEKAKNIKEKLNWIKGILNFINKKNKLIEAAKNNSFSAEPKKEVKQQDPGLLARGAHRIAKRLGLTDQHLVPMVPKENIENSQKKSSEAQKPTEPKKEVKQQDPVLLAGVTHSDTKGIDLIDKSLETKENIKNSQKKSSEAQKPTEPEKQAGQNTPDKNSIDPSKEKMDQLVSMMDKKPLSHLDKEDIVNHIEKNFDSKSLKANIKNSDGSELSIIEYAVKNNLGSKIVGAILNKADKDTFSMDQLQNASKKLEKLKSSVSSFAYKENSRIKKSEEKVNKFK